MRASKPLPRKGPHSLYLNLDNLARLKQLIDHFNAEERASLTVSQVMDHLIKEQIDEWERSIAEEYSDGK